MVILLINSCTIETGEIGKKLYFIFSLKNTVFILLTNLSSLYFICVARKVRINNKKNVSPFLSNAKYILFENFL